VLPDEFDCAGLQFSPFRQFPVEGLWTDPNLICDPPLLPRFRQDAIPNNPSVKPRRHCLERKDFGVETRALDRIRKVLRPSASEVRLLFEPTT
jgi:hypothetical protein